MTLDDLLASFGKRVDTLMVALSERFGGEGTNPSDFIVGVRERDHMNSRDAFLTWFKRDEYCLEDILDHLKPVETAARLYVIARNEGMDAAMLWKLSQA